MTVRQTNLMLWALAAAFAAGAVACAVIGMTLPTDVVIDSHAARTAATVPATRESQLSLGDFESIWTLKLRGSLTDAPAGAAAGNAAAGKDTDAPAAGGPFVLLGTIGDSLAMIRTAAGAGVELRGLGESANGAKIVAIRPSQVDVEVDGQRMTIAKPRERGGG